MYFAEMGGVDFTLAVVQTNYSGFDPIKSLTIDVVDSKLCNISTSWCDYCIDRQRDHPLFPIQPNYTCQFNITTDLCGSNSNLYDSAICASVNGTSGSNSIKVDGSVLLSGFGIEEIGKSFVYETLAEHSLFYFLACVLLTLLFFKEWPTKRSGPKLSN